MVFMKLNWCFRSACSALAVTLCATILSSCSLIGDRSNEYKRADEGRPLILPASLAETKLRERYPIPEVDSTNVPEGKFELPLPPDATLSLSEDPYEVKVFDGDSWLELAMPPSKAWPLIDSFWLDYGLVTHTERVSDGYFGTEVLDESVAHDRFISDLESTSHTPIVIEGVSFQAKLTQGIRRNTSELQVRAFMPDVAREQQREWSKEAVTPRIERALLELIGEVVTGESSGSRYSLNAVNIGDQSRVRLLEDEAGYPYLEIQLSYKRAWSEVQDALEASPAVVSARDEKGGVAYVSYLDEEEIDSWYTLESSLEEQKAERNIELRFYPQGPDVIHVRAKMLSEELEPESARTLIELVFEYIS